MRPLSKAVAGAPKSKIRKLFDMASGRSDVISLGIGQPDFKPPRELIDGTIRALKEGKTVYAPTRGIPELKEAVAAKLKKVNGIEADPEENIIITNGGSQAITLAFAVLLNPGENIIVFSPNFVSYFYCSTFFGAEAREVPRREDMSPDFNKAAEMVDSNTKAVIVCSPNNPTGYVYTEKDWKMLKEMVLEHDLYIISDEPYEMFVYDDARPYSPASDNELFDRVITLNAISKTFGAPGFRVGYAVASREIIDLMETYMQYTVAGVNHPAQYGALEALRAEAGVTPDIIEKFRRRRDFVYGRLSEMGFETIKPRGAFYIMPSVEPFGMDADTFAMSLMERYAVAVVPGDIFGKYSRNRIRISYAVDMDRLEESMNRIEKFLKKIK